MSSRMELHMSFTNHHTARLLVALAAASIVGCSASDATSTSAASSVKLSFITQDPSTAASDVSLSTAPVTSGGHTLDITSVALNISRVELHTAQHLEMITECEHQTDCGLIDGSPLMVTLTPTPSLVTVTTAIVPPGDYREIGIKFASVRLVGTFDGKPFDVVVNVGAEREMEFDPPVTIGGASDTQRNITIIAPVTTWLTNSDGTLVNPAQLGITPGLQAGVENRIRASLRAFRDDNENGRDDDNDEHIGKH
jgi:hypothetical protein